jgi:hypothetical protein
LLQALKNRKRGCGGKAKAEAQVTPKPERNERKENNISQTQPGSKEILAPAMFNRAASSLIRATNTSTGN